MEQTVRAAVLVVVHLRNVDSPARRNVLPLLRQPALSQRHCFFHCAQRKIPFPDGSGVKQVLLKSGKILPADVFVTGIGRIAALNMLKKQVGINSVPFFWTMLMGKSFRYAGYGEGHTEVIMKGKVEEMKFLAFYIKYSTISSFCFNQPKHKYY
ncbi:Apoptosis-inducing factor 3 [Acipenser ruthenus]|uniref:Apoptosis-inducing factor 3 n=1 Tax=Acipenser ruthenus TaxID=7906 RepID=A0A444UXE2_ACIRT|nr:Apoptosis-inducing factor 3 [Acipenser ruthenus]